jgi:hypothetical protein
MSTWREDAEINRSRLDDECAHMPSKYGRWSDFEQQACAKEDHAAHQLLLAEDAMKKAQAKAHLQLRGWSIAKINRELKTEIDPTRPSLSEQIYKDLVLMHPLVTEAEAALNTARINFMTAKAHRREMQSARYTMDIKDKSLKKLVDIGDRMFGMSGSYQPRGRSAVRAAVVPTAVSAAIKAYQKGAAAAPGSLQLAAGRIKE